MCFYDFYLISHVFINIHEFLYQIICILDRWTNGPFPYHYFGAKFSNLGQLKDEI